MRPAFAFLVLLVAGPALAQTAPATPPAANGPAQFEDQCGSCHSLESKSSVLGPSLKGVVGRKIGSLGDFDYSSGLKTKVGAWTDENLDAYIADPQTFAPGNQMFEGDADPVSRKAIIDYLKTKP